MPLIFDDLIDFDCSPAWLNHYHARGMTPRVDLTMALRTLEQVEADIRSARIERDKAYLHDEEWFEQQLRTGSIQRIMDKKQEEITALRGELVALHQEKKRAPNGGEHRGIKED